MTKFSGHSAPSRRSIIKGAGAVAAASAASADWVVPMPTGMSPFEAMALGTAGFTAALAIARMEQNGLRPGTERSR